MLLGVVSDTHNNLKNIESIITLFNEREVDLVIHTGDITNSKSLDKFSQLRCHMICVYGNNDRSESGLEEIAIKNKFELEHPPYITKIAGKKIAIFHEPENINEFLSKNIDLDVILHGHTHRHREEILNGTLIFNPGESAGMIKGKNTIGIINLKDMSISKIFF